MGLYEMREKIVELGTCSLSPIVFSDLEPIRAWRNEQMEILRHSKELTPEDQERYWKRLSESMETRLFSIISDGKLIGYCGFTHLDNEYSHSELSFLLDTSIQENSDRFYSILFDVLKMLVRYGFENLNLNRLSTETYEFRKEHIQTIEKAGFTKEGILREHVFKKGRFYNSIIHSILRSEYRAE